MNGAQRINVAQRLWFGAERSLLSCFFEALVDFGPVDDVPPGGEVVGAAVLVLEVVGVLPDVISEDRVEALAERRVLVGRRDDLQLATLDHKPAPSGAELLGSGLVEGLLEGFKIAEVLLDLVGEGSARRAADAGGIGRAHDRPKD